MEFAGNLGNASVELDKIWLQTRAPATPDLELFDLTHLRRIADYPLLVRIWKLVRFSRETGFVNRQFWQRFTFAILFFLTLEFAAWSAAKLLIVSAPLNSADAIVVFSGSATYAERTQRAAELYRKGVASRIILTNDGGQGGWSSTEQRNPFFYEMARDNLLRCGVPASHIEVVYPPVSGTYEEASVVRNYAEMRALRSLLIVTSAYHSRRALWTLRRVFVDTPIAIGLEAVETGNQTPSPLTWWLHVRGWQMIPEEYVKTIYYYLYAKSHS